jgi:hypothetical protein
VHAAAITSRHVHTHLLRRRDITAVPLVNPARARWLQAALVEEQTRGAESCSMF